MNHWGPLGESAPLIVAKRYARNRVNFLWTRGGLKLKKSPMTARVFQFDGYEVVEVPMVEVPLVEAENVQIIDFGGGRGLTAQPMGCYEIL